MEYQKIITFLDNAVNHPSEIIKKRFLFKSTMLKMNLCDQSDIFILVKGTISILPETPPALNPDNNNKEVVF